MTVHPSTPTDARRRVPVELGARAYEVIIGRALLEDLPSLCVEALVHVPRAVFVVVDRNAQDHADSACDAMVGEGWRVLRHTLDATETNKSLDTVADLLHEMGRARLERSDLVVAIGGGITGDVAGFAAATYRRGLAVVQCPTTLLAMVDASVGGKTGVNLSVEGQLQKNMAGAFHQPSLVLADTDTLATLPDREFRAGLAECIKHGMIDGAVRDGEHLAWIESSLDDVLARRPHAVLELIERSVACKAAVVAQDEQETSSAGGRALLNLGHTFAHAIETLPDLSPTTDQADAPLLHGEAVALGLVAACATATHLGKLPPSCADRVASTLTRCGLPIRVEGLPGCSTLIQRMGADKKVSGGRLRVVLPLDRNRAEIIENPDHIALNAGWTCIGASR